MTFCEIIHCQNNSTCVEAGHQSSCQCTAFYSGERCEKRMWNRIKPGVHTNDFAPIYGRRGPKLGHASQATVFRPSRLIFQAILRENLESPVLRYQPITTALIPDACLNTRWHRVAFTGIFIIMLYFEHSFSTNPVFK